MSGDWERGALAEVVRERVTEASEGEHVEPAEVAGGAGVGVHPAELRVLLLVVVRGKRRSLVLVLEAAGKALVGSAGMQCLLRHASGRQMRRQGVAEVRHPVVLVVADPRLRRLDLKRVRGAHRIARRRRGRRRR
jgi:hypothetical protein